MTNPNEVTGTDAAIKRLYELIGDQLVVHEWEAVKRELLLMESRTSATSDAAGGQPIETIPKTSGNFLVCTATGFRKTETGNYMHHMMNAAKVDGDKCFYTHWQNLPPPPVSAGGG